MTEEEAYHELCAYTLTRGDAEFIHQHVVDAYAAQTASADTKPIKLTFALVGLHLHLDRGFTGREVQRAHQYLAREKRAWPGFEVPQDRGELSALDVVSRPAGEDRDKAIHAWAESVWAAFRKAAPTTAAIIAGLCETSGLFRRR